MDSFWLQYSDYIVGIPATILALIAIFYTRKQLQKKGLEYNIVASESLLSYHNALKEDLYVSFRGQKIDNLILFKIEFINTGNIAILKNDFESNIQLKLKNINSIINLGRILKYPSNLTLHVEVNQDFIEIKPLLLNPKDKFFISALIDGTTNKLEIEIFSRIAGLNKIEQKKRNLSRIEQFTIIFSSIFFIGLFALAALLFIEGDFIPAIGVLSLIFISFISAYYDTFIKIKRGKKST